MYKILAQELFGKGQPFGSCPLDENGKIPLEYMPEKVYGVRRALIASSSAWERIADSYGLSANATKTGGEALNDFDDIYPWSDIKTYNYDVESGEIIAWIGDADFKFDGTNGEVLTKIPEFYYKRFVRDGYEYCYITKYAKTGYMKSEEFSLGRYKMSDGGHSFNATSPRTNLTITQHRNLAKSLGTGFGQLDWRYFAVQLLYLVEYADYNSQDKLGNGVTLMDYSASRTALVAETNTNNIVISTANSAYFAVGQQVDIGTSQGGRQIAKDRTITAIADYSADGVTGKSITFDGDPVNVAVGNMLYCCGQKSGGCDSLGMKSGCLVNDSKHSMIYRGIEDIFGNVFEWIDGINIKDRVPYICYDPTKYVVDKFNEDFVAMDSDVATLASSDGYAKTLCYDENHPLIGLTAAVGGGSTTYMCDYFYQATGNRVLCVGGYFNYGASAGLWCFYACGASSHSGLNRGARLLKY